MEGQQLGQVTFTTKTGIVAPGFILGDPPSLGLTCAPPATPTPPPPPPQNPEINTGSPIAYMPLAKIDIHVGFFLIMHLLCPHT